ncbi:MAG: transglutaminase [Ruminococcus sp.]|nr:transglutaminase [Ruminococcus sp.]
MIPKKTAAVLAAAVLVLGSCGADPAGETSSVQDSSAAQTEESSAPEENSSVRSDPETYSGADNGQAKEKKELYDTRHISDAYLAGVTVMEDEKDQVILDSASALIDEIITEDMGDYEKELAVHDWMIRELTYDPGELSVFGEMTPDADDPYGAFVNGMCICSGYTTTFQLLMDMLEIPCHSIQGVDSEGEDHAWNEVEIDGRWYFADVTWDDPVPDREGRPVRHTYFNVTSEFMAERHVWDMKAFPEAVSYEDSHIAHGLRDISDWEEIIGIISELERTNTEEVYLRPAGSLGVDLSSSGGQREFLGDFNISSELEDVMMAHKKELNGIGLYFQKVKYGDEVVLAAHLKGERKS